MLDPLTIYVKMFRCETLEHTAVKTNLSVLFDRYVPILQVDLPDTVASQLPNISIMLNIYCRTPSARSSRRSHRSLPFLTSRSEQNEPSL